jgi:hypothetical protein
MHIRNVARAMPAACLCSYWLIKNKGAFLLVDFLFGTFLQYLEAHSKELITHRATPCAIKIKIRNAKGFGS